MSKEINARDQQIIDSSLSQLQQLQSNKDQIAAYQKLVNFTQDHQYDSLTILYYSKILQLHDSDDNPDLYAQTNLALGQIYNTARIFNSDTALYYFNQAQKVFDKLSKERQVEMLISLTGIHYTLYRFEEAIAYCVDCIELAKEINDQSSLQFCYSRMAAYSEIYLNDDKKVIEYARKALQIAKEIGDHNDLAYYYLLYAMQLNSVHQSKEALNQLDTCEHYMRLIPDKNLLCDLYLTRAAAHQNLSQLNLAKKYLNKGLHVADSMGLKNRLMHIPLTLAQIALDENQFDQVIVLSKKALTIFPDQLTLFELESGHNLLYQAYEKQQNHLKALTHYKQWNIYKDSMNTLNNLGVITNIERKYKNQEQKQKIKNQTKEISEQSRKRVIFSLLFFIVSLFAIGLVILSLFMRASREKIKVQHDIIIKQTEDLKKLDQVKSQFFANISHELRSPLTLILGPVGTVLQSGHLSNRNFTLLQKAQQSGKDLLKLVVSILDFTKLDSKTIELKEEIVFLYPFIRTIISTYETYALHRSIRFSFSYQAPENLYLELDKEKLEIIINNLLSNAIKFTQSGGKVHLIVKDLKENIQISVSDTGRGIHPEEQAFIFNRFYQSKHPESTTEGGAGIGLALSKEFALLMNGDIWIESKFRIGSTFFLKFPRKEALGYIPEDRLIEDKAPTFDNLDKNTNQTSDTFNKFIEGSAPNSNKPHILVVEDNHSLSEYLKIILEDKYEVTIVEHGLAALDFLQTNLQHKYPCDLIISDLMMPEMDGLQLLEVLKSRTYFNHMPIIMLTARADIQDKLKALRFGVDDYLVKPFQEEELLVRIENLLNNASNRKDHPQEKNKEESSIPEFSKEDMEWLAEFEAYIIKNLNNSDLAVTDVTDAFAMSKSTLSRQLKKLTGLTPKKYIQEVRLNKARGLLEDRTFNTIAQVAYEVGYLDAKSFTRSFKARFGISPSETLSR